MKRDISRITGKICALTFDDGPSNTTLEILELLEKYGCSASFFIIGNRALGEEKQSIMKKAHDMGCTIENHSWDHKGLRDMNEAELLGQFEATQKAVYDAVGEYPVFFRAPGLGNTELMFRTIPLTFANGRGGSADWNSREDDPATSDLETRINGIFNVVEDGLIMLMHDCSNNYLTPQALSVALPKLIEDDWSFVNLRELFEIKGQALTPHASFGWTNVVKDREKL